MVWRIPWVWLLQCWVLLSPLVVADGFVRVASADGARNIEIRPLDVVAADPPVLLVEKKDGAEVRLPLASVGQGRERLERWHAQVLADPQHQLRNRLAGKRELGVLFIGNSFTFGLPEMLKRLARAEGKSIRVSELTRGGWTLAQHAEDSNVLESIRDGRWDLVVLQEQSQVPGMPVPQRDARMLNPVRMLVEQTRSGGADPVLYQTWGRRDGDTQNAQVFPNDNYKAMQQRTIDGYDAISASLGGIALARVGQAWAAIHELGHGAALFSADGIHPSAAGVYLNACVFYSLCFDLNIKRGLPEVVPDALRQIIQATAGDVGRWTPPPMS
ncbi:MAG: SGNH/GDSL hydrolase family protein [Luteolibacter sp.]